MILGQKLVLHSCIDCESHVRAADRKAVAGLNFGDAFKHSADPSLHMIITRLATTIIVSVHMFIGALLVHR